MICFILIFTLIDASYGMWCHRKSGGWDYYPDNSGFRPCHSYYDCAEDDFGSPIKKNRWSDLCRMSSNDNVVLSKKTIKDKLINSDAFKKSRINNDEIYINNDMVGSTDKKEKYQEILDNSIKNARKLEPKF